MTNNKDVEEMVERIVEDLAARLAYRAGLGAGEYEAFMQDDDVLWLRNKLTKALKQEGERVRGEINNVIERHANWKPTEGYGSDEEKGYQKGLMAEARLIKKDIKNLTNKALQDNK